MDTPQEQATAETVQADLTKAEADLHAIAADAVPGAVTPERIAAIIDPCFRQYANGTVLSRDTEIYKQAYAFKEELKARLEKEFSK